MASDKYTAQEMIDALTFTKGMITVAARKLGCAPNTVRRYIREYKTVAEAKREAHENLGDQVELTLASMALGERDAAGRFIREPNIAALIFIAKTKFRDRGYVEKQHVQVDDWRSQAIEYIRRGELSFEALADEFDPDLATELFRAAGVPVEVGTGTSED